MRKSRLLVLLSLTGCAVSAANDFHERHAKLHEKRQDVDWVTVTSLATTTAATVTVYIDLNGKTVSVATQTNTKSSQSTTASSSAVPPSTNTTQSSTPGSSSSNTVTSSVSIPAPSTTATTSNAGAVAPAQEAGSVAAAPSTASPASYSSGGFSNFKGIVYSPYKGSLGSSSCKSAAEVAEDFSSIPAGLYNLVRLYGVDCNQVANVAAVAIPLGMKLFLGVYNVAGGAYASDIASMSSQLNGDWSNVHTVSIGNEAVSNGTPLNVIISALNDVKANILNGKGPKVVAVDTFYTVIANPSLCQNSDYNAVNMHPFFDPLTTAETAGSFMITQMANVKAACANGGDTIITETGWPNAGQVLNLAIPGFSQQATAVGAIESAVGQNYVILSAFNEYWKSPGVAGVEPFFGLYGSAPSDNA